MNETLVELIQRAIRKRLHAFCSTFHLFVAVSAGVIVNAAVREKPVFIQTLVKRARGKCT